MTTLDLSPAALAAANIVPETGLATDYLNHFNEVAMLIEMLEAMPEGAEDIVAWQPMPYEQHFHATGFRAKELAVAAFHAADPAVRQRFLAMIAKANAAVQDVQARIAAQADPASFAAAASADLFDRIAALNAVILGEAGVGGGDEQAAIDALFD